MRIVAVLLTRGNIRRIRLQIGDREWQYRLGKHISQWEIYFITRAASKCFVI